MCLENNLNKIRNNFPNICDKYQRLFKHTAEKEKNNIDYKMLLCKVKGINFFARYDTLYNYLDHLLSLVQKKFRKR